MKFVYAESPEAKTWMNPRYVVQIQHVKEQATNFVVFVGVNDSGDKEEYSPLYPRFETQGKTVKEGLYSAGGIAEALVREMRKMPEDTPLSKIEKLLKTVKKLLERAYGLGGSSKTQILLPGRDF